MTEGMVLQGREVTAADVELIRALLAAHPARGRTPLSEDLCRRWGWRNARGQLKDMACRTLLLKLERAGYIRLPPRIRPSSNGLRNRRACVAPPACEPIRGALRDLQRLTNNTRFLIPGWVRVPHLASHVLGIIARRICADWRTKYGHPVHALETFVDRSRFKGTCYRAANWRRLGQTRGRTRNDRAHRIQASVKDVYLYPLVADFRRELCA